MCYRSLSKCFNCTIVSDAERLGPAGHMWARAEGGQAAGDPPSPGHQAPVTPAAAGRCSRKQSKVQAGQGGGPVWASVQARGRDE